MKIEELNKTQIVLLTLLVSFVTSIATGIVTVSLVDQAPPSVTQTINRVVERTVEKVIPSETRGQSAGVITKETTVVVKDEDLITGSIEKNSASLVDIQRVISISPEGRNESFVGLGLVLSSDGLIATDVSSVYLNSKYSVSVGNSSYALDVLSEDQGSGIALLKISAGELKDNQKLPAVVLGNASAAKLGQTVISLTGRERKTVSIGIISSLVTREVQKADKTTEIVLSAIETNLNPGKIIGIAPLLNLFGEVVGINLGSQIDTSRAFPVETLKQQMALLSPASTK